MSKTSRKSLARWWTAALVLGLGAVLAMAIVRSERLAEGPVDIVWDREACAHCRMHVGEPGFAAQLQLKSGSVLNYDDPGCLLEHLEKHSASDIHAMWFRHVTEDRWLGAEEVGFRRVEPTPMGYGLGATYASEAGALSLDRATIEVRARGSSGREH